MENPCNNCEVYRRCPFYTDDKENTECVYENLERMAENGD